MKKILIIEDERDLADLLAYNLEKEGFAASCVHNGSDGLEAAQHETPDLIILDLMLPGMMGTEVCKILRKSVKTAQVPVLMVTAKSDEIDRVVGFEVGADDYIVKPFSMRELTLRVKAILRRCDGEQVQAQPQPMLKLGEINIDTERHQVVSAGSPVELTSTEFKLLLYLTERCGRVISRDQLLQNVWSYNDVGDTRTVDTHITRLRSKLGAPGDQIKTVRGFGYKMEEV
ncbi:MAG TPA: response regulator transcription factor [Deltaproteobacteria bacterium]|nr:response regulator transcription factor [Deltaproteobacteria bacterium]HQB39092.1 response regulator transcription factor [Deltaproteobacteria bacterium]